MKKKLIIINGTMGVGKTTTCRDLNKRLKQSVWLDGDWCWMINPFVANVENKRMVEGNIKHLLRSFLNNSSIDYIIFSWVIHSDEIMKMVLEWVQGFDLDICKITLNCSEDEIKKRLMKREPGLHNQDLIDRSIEKLPSFQKQDTIKIDTSNKGVEVTVEEIMKVLENPEYIPHLIEK